MRLKNSFISKIKYKEEQKILIVYLKDKSIYRYSGISKKLYNNFLRAKSPGKYYYQKISRRLFDRLIHVHGYVRTSATGKKIRVKPYCRVVKTV